MTPKRSYVTFLINCIFRSQIHVWWTYEPVLLAAVCQGPCTHWAWGWSYGSSYFTCGKTEVQSTLHRAPRGTHGPEPNILIPVLGLMSPDKWTFEIVSEVYVNWTRWRNWSLGTKIELKAQWPCLEHPPKEPGFPWKAMGFCLILSTPLLFSEDYETLLPGIWSSDVSKSS